MYSFRSRPDTNVFDEPLYGHYLRVTGIDHPGRDETLAAAEPDGAAAIRDIILGPCDTPVLFLKSMGHHTTGVGLDLSFLDKVTNVFLAREPRDMLISLAKGMPYVRVDMTGLAQQVEVLDRILEGGGDPIVLVARIVLDNPESVLRELCERVGVAWDASMLHWPSGPKPEDGVWGKHWYHRLWETTGFERYRPKNEPFPDGLRPVLEECERYYERLAPYAINAS